jgi:hypothetical protein
VLFSPAPEAALATRTGRTLVALGALLGAFLPAYTGGINGITLITAQALTSRRRPR